MPDQLQLSGECLATDIALVFLLRLTQRPPSSQDRLLRSVHYQARFRIEILVARVATIGGGDLLDEDGLAIDFFKDNVRRSFIASLRLRNIFSMIPGTSFVNSGKKREYMDYDRN